MSDHFEFNIHVTINDRSVLAYEQKERGDEIKQRCVYAVKNILEEHGFKEYRDEFWVNA